MQYGRWPQQESHHNFVDYCWSKKHVLVTCSMPPFAAVWIAEPALAPDFASRVFVCLSTRIIMVLSQLHYLDSTGGSPTKGRWCVYMKSKNININPRIYIYMWYLNIRIKYVVFFLHWYDISEFRHFKYIQIYIQLNQLIFFEPFG